VLYGFNELEVIFRNFEAEQLTVQPFLCPKRRLKFPAWVSIHRQCFTNSGHVFNTKWNFL